MSEQKSTADASTAERQQAVEELYVRNYSVIRDACGMDAKLSFDAEQRITEAVAKYLSSYEGPLTDEAFTGWVRSIVTPGMFLAALYRDLEEYVRGAIRKVFSSCADLGISEHHVRDAEQMTWLWAWEHIESLRDPNQRAKPKTRLYSVAKFAALSIRKTALRAKARFKDVGLARLGADPNSYEWCGVVIEPLSAKEEQDDPYQRTETTGPKTSRPK